VGAGQGLRARRRRAGKPGGAEPRADQGGARDVQEVRGDAAAARGSRLCRQAAARVVVAGVFPRAGDRAAGRDAGGSGVGGRAVG
jgi:hypothetical protein